MNMGVHRPHPLTYPTQLKLAPNDDDYLSNTRRMWCIVGECGELYWVCVLHRQLTIIFKVYSPKELIIVNVCVGNEIMCTQDTEFVKN